MAAWGFVAGIVLVALAGLLKRRSRFGYILTVVLLAIMSQAGLLDQFGIADLLYALVTLLPVALLLKHRAWYVRPGLVGAEEEECRGCVTLA